jgi:hypothetical protein
MSSRSFFFRVRLALIIVFLALVALEGCSSRSSSGQTVEKPIPMAAPASSTAVTAAPVKLPPPTQAEVEAAFHRVFGDNLIVNAANRQSFIVGDFNGDGAEDLAIIARPATGKLTEVNSELANWTIQDADKAFIAPAGKAVVVPPRQARPHVETGEEVLAIIHGYGPQGWRNPDARQAYLIKHAAATFAGTAPSLSQKAVRAMKLPVETEIIKEVRNSKKGFLFWTGGVYAWHPSEG